MLIIKLQSDHHDQWVEECLQALFTAATNLLPGNNIPIT